MPKTRHELTEVLQVRVSKEGKAAIEKAADEEQSSVAEFTRRTLYQASKFIRTKTARIRTKPAS
jgi:uncharacterized protein (DUF1778 family)